jgi:biopolymer transport protein ExbD
MNAPNINVTPLIDVLLVLLIIFMVVTPVKPSRFEARVPSERRDERVVPNPYTIVVSVTPNREIRINQEPTAGTVDDPSAAIDRLKEVFAQREANFVTERTVFIKAPLKLDYGSVARVVDVVKLAGARPVSLQIDRLD